MYKYSQKDILIWLNSVGVSNRVIGILCSSFPDIREIVEVKKDTFLKLKGIKELDLGKIIKNRSTDYIDRILDELKLNKISAVTMLDPDYPRELANIYDKPYVLFKRGSILDKDSLAIAIVGARKATAYGRWACEKFTKELVGLGVTIVSGLALGIDAVAHKTAIQEGGRTIGILGNGIDYVYPKRNEALYNQIPRNGAILTEFPMGTPPLAYNFPRRNRIIAGLSLGIVVIEAKEKSGSLITAHHALEQGKDVFALPGNINSIYSRGTNRLIKDGARPLLDLEDILEEISFLQKVFHEKTKKDIDLSNLSKTEITITKIIEEGPIHSDLIAYKTGLQIPLVVSTLTILEMKGIVKELNNQIFTLC